VLLLLLLLLLLYCELYWELYWELLALEVLVLGAVRPGVARGVGWGC
jgi:hypothetical protein